MNKKSLFIIRSIAFGLSILMFSCTLLSGAPSGTTPVPPATSEAAEPAENAEPQATAESLPEEAPAGGRFTYADMVVGFLQTGDEGGWRGANSASFVEIADELGISLNFHESQNDVEDQRDAFRDFIADDEINVIVLAALDNSGWDSLLRDAKDAGKVVVIEDRRIDAPQDLYATYVGSDFVEEGRKAAGAMCRLLEGSAKKNVVELIGDPNAPAAQDRGEGFREKMGDCGITITYSQVANWGADDAKLAMNDFLQKTSDIQGVFAQNDEMALGAIQAIKDAGLNPGSDIKLVSIDATRAAFEAMVAGDLNATVECNPWLAPQVYEAALKALNGEELPKWIPSNEEVFYAEEAAGMIDSRRY